MKPRDAFSTSGGSPPASACESAAIITVEPTVVQETCMTLPEPQSMSAAITLIEHNNHSSTYTDAENLARHIISRLDSVAAKLKSLEDDIRRLWIAFDNLKTGETILGCTTKKEFCEKKLHRTHRAIQYLLAGGNPNNENVHYNKPSEIISPPAPPITLSLPNAVQIAVGIGDYVVVQRWVNACDEREGVRVVIEKVVSVTGGRCDRSKYFVVTENLTCNKNHFDTKGKSYDGCGQIIGFADSKAIDKQAKQEIGDAWRALQKSEADLRTDANAWRTVQQSGAEAKFAKVEPTENPESPAAETAPKPPKNAELVAAILAHEKAAKDLKSLLQTNGIDADVSRSKSDGKFHVVWHDATAEHIHKFAETFKS